MMKRHQKVDTKRNQNKIDLDQISVDRNYSILSAIKHMDQIKSKLLLVTSSGRYYSLLSIGDIQRAIIHNVDLNTTFP